MTILHCFLDILLEFVGGVGIQHHEIVVADEVEGFFLL